MPKITGVRKDSNVAALYRDLDTLEKVVTVYDTNDNELPIIGDAIPQSNLSEGLQMALNKANDSATHLYKLDLTKFSSNITSLRYGHTLNNEDYFLYSKDTNIVYYASGLENSKGETVYALNQSVVNIPTIQNIALGGTPLVINQTNNSPIPYQNLTGTIRVNNTLNVIVNGIDISSTVVYGTPTIMKLNNNLLEKTVYAGELRKTFSVPLNMKIGELNNIELLVPEKKLKFHYDVNVEANYSAPKLTIDTSTNPVKYTLIPPSGVNVAAQEWVLDNGNATSTSPTSLLSAGTHTINVRIKDSIGKYSDWETQTFNVKPMNLIYNMTNPSVLSTSTILLNKEYNKNYGSRLDFQFTDSKNRKITSIYAKHYNAYFGGCLVGGREYSVNYDYATGFNATIDPPSNSVSIALYGSSADTLTIMKYTVIDSEGWNTNNEIISSTINTQAAPTSLLLTTTDSVPSGGSLNYYYSLNGINGTWYPIIPGQVVPVNTTSKEIFLKAVGTKGTNGQLPNINYWDLKSDVLKQ